MILLFGPAGSGKTTQGQELARRLKWKWVSVGQVLRDTGAYDDILKQGELVADEEVAELMHEKMAEIKGGAIIDGYPRDVWQAEWLAEHDLDKIEGAVVLDVPAEELWKRIMARGRMDDTEEAVKRRLEIFEQNIYSILKVLDEHNVKNTTVDGMGTIGEVSERLIGAIEEMLGMDEKDISDGERSYGE